MRYLRSLSIAVTAGAAAVVGASLVNPRAAIADGAFPASMALFVPSDKPNRIIQTTNFGLAISDDGAANWYLVCEAAVAPFASQYQMGPAPDRVLFAVASDGLILSRDGGCTWTKTLDASQAVPRDVFPDPSDPQHVLLIVRSVGTSSTSTATDALLESTDGGATFPTVLYTAEEPTSRIYSVELAATDRSTVYFTMLVQNPQRLLLGRSSDGGARFELVDHTAVLGPGISRIAQVDPEDPDVIYLRVQPEPPETGDRLAISRDGGRTVEVVHHLAGKMSTFLRRADGALMVSDSNNTFVSRNAGMIFEPWPANNLFPPHPGWLAERAGKIFVSANNFSDGFAVGSTEDEGETFTPLFAYVDLCGPMQCGRIPEVCQIPWETLKGNLGITTTCGAANTDAGIADGSGAAKPEKDCGCTATRSRGSESAFGLMGVLAFLTLIRKKRSTGGLIMTMFVALAVPAAAGAQNPARPNTTAELTEPSSIDEVADLSFTIAWTDNDMRIASSAATSDFFYSRTDVAAFNPGTVPEGLEGRPIARAVRVWDEMNMIVWDTSSVAPDAYFIWSRTYDPDAMLPKAMIHFAPGRVIVAHAGDPVTPTAALLPPENPFVWPPADSLEIAYATYDPGGTAEVKIEATSRARPADVVTIATDLPSQGGSATWDTRAVAEGEWALSITISDDAGGLSSTSHERIFRTVNHLTDPASAESCGCSTATPQAPHASTLLLLLLLLLLPAALAERLLTRCRRRPTPRTLFRTRASRPQ